MGGGKVCLQMQHAGSGLAIADAYCGMGSFGMAAERCGHRVTWAFDICKEAIKTYRLNCLSPNAQIDCADIYRMQIFPDVRVDVLTAGIPCQPFSTMGKQLGHRDRRGQHWERLAKMIDRYRPRMLILENVMGLLKNPSLYCFRHHMSCNGYKQVVVVLNCRHFGLPQNRKRVFVFFVLGTSRKRMQELKTALLTTGKRYRSLSSMLGRPMVRTHTKTIRVGGRQSPYGTNWCWNKYERQDGTVHTLSFAEIKQLQGFDETVLMTGSLNQRYKMLGNSIPFNLTDHIFRVLTPLFPHVCRVKEKAREKKEARSSGKSRV